MRRVGRSTSGGLSDRLKRPLVDGHLRRPAQVTIAIARNPAVSLGRTRSRRCMGTRPCQPPAGRPRIWREEEVPPDAWVETRFCARASMWSRPAWSEAGLIVLT